MNRITEYFRGEDMDDQFFHVDSAKRLVVPCDDLGVALTARLAPSSPSESLSSGSEAGDSSEAINLPLYGPRSKPHIQFLNWLAEMSASGS